MSMTMIQTMTDAPASLADALRDATSDAHRDIENRPLQKQIATGAVEPETLARYLQQLRHLHAAIEGLVDRLRDRREDVAPLLDADMHHSARLDEDLERIRTATPGIDAPTPEMTDTIDRLRMTSEHQQLAIIGALYVLEGSMNGNAFIVRGLRRSKAITASMGLSYFDPYGETQRERWQAFRSHLDRLDITTDERIAIIETAEQTFRDLARVGDAITTTA